MGAVSTLSVNLCTVTGATESRLNPMVKVELMSRASCGSCSRVAEQIRPLILNAGAELEIIDVDTSAELAAEFGDRVPVVVVAGEEVACWEIDDEELLEAIAEAAHN